MKKLLIVAIACCMLAAIAVTLTLGTFAAHSTSHTVHTTRVAWNGNGTVSGQPPTNCSYNPDDDTVTCW